MKNKKANILGTEYNIFFVNRSEDDLLKKLDGYCDHTTKKIVICNMFNDKDKENYTITNFHCLIKKTIRHEIIHAFLFESGLAYNSNDIESWAMNEEMVDWIAYQFPKIYEVFKKLDCLEN